MNKEAIVKSLENAIVEYFSMQLIMPHKCFKYLIAHSPGNPNHILTDKTFRNAINSLGDEDVANMLKTRMECCDVINHWGQTALDILPDDVITQSEFDHYMLVVGFSRLYRQALANVIKMI